MVCRSVPVSAAFFHAHAAAVEKLEYRLLLDGCLNRKQLPHFVGGHHVGQPEGLAGIEFGEKVVRALENLLEEEGNAGGHLPAFGEAAAECFFDVADILLHLVGGDFGGHRVGVVLKHEAQFAHIVTDGALRVTAYGHNLCYLE